jgi:hypothetical protein
VSGQLHAPAALPAGEKFPDTHWIGGLVVRRSVLDAVEKRKILLLPGIFVFVQLKWVMLQEAENDLRGKEVNIWRQTTNKREKLISDINGARVLRRSYIHVMLLQSLFQ